jgi:hypothetical protein
MKLEPIDRRGRRLAETVLVIGERDRWFAEAAGLFMRDQSSRAAAHRLHVALARYREGAWRRERTAETVPLCRRSRLDGHLWMILRARDAIPSERTIRAAIDAAKKSSPALFVAHGGYQTSAR